MKMAAFCTLDAFSIGTRLRLDARERVMNMRPMFGDGFGDGSIVAAKSKARVDVTYVRCAPERPGLPPAGPFRMSRRSARRSSGLVLAP